MLSFFIKVTRNIFDIDTQIFTFESDNIFTKVSISGRPTPGRVRADIRNYQNINTGPFFTPLDQTRRENLCEAFSSLNILLILK